MFYITEQKKKKNFIAQRYRTLDAMKGSLYFIFQHLLSRTLHSSSEVNLRLIPHSNIFFQTQ